MPGLNESSAGKALQPEPTTDVTTTFSAYMRWRPLWRWRLFRLACRLPLPRLIVALASGLRYDYRVGNEPWMIGGRLSATLGDPVSFTLTAEGQ